MNLKQMQKDIHSLADEKGFWNMPINVSEKVALIHSELSEFIEHLRNQVMFVTSDKLPTVCNGEEELADVIIRVLDLAEYYGFDMEKAILSKHEYNKTRPYKHNKLF